MTSIGERARNEATTVVLDQLLAFCNRDDIFERNVRSRNLAPFQLHTFIGSSYVKRVLSGVMILLKRSVK